MVTKVATRRKTMHNGCEMLLKESVSLQSLHWNIYLPGTLTGICIGDTAEPWIQERSIKVCMMMCVTVLSLQLTTAK